MTSVDIFVQHYADAAAMPEQLALDIARIVYPGANTGYYEEQIDGLGAEMGKVLEGRNPGRGLIQGFLQAFNRDLGFRGNKDDYYDPCNSLLPDVIARKTGLPIMLCVLCMAIGRRVYMRMEGLGFPHHFLVIYHDGPEAWVLDPFHGVVVEPNGTEDHLSKVLGRAVRLPAQMWEPVTPHAIAARILNNLHHAYLLAQNLPMVAHVLDYLIAVNPTEQQYWHERGLIHYREQRWEEAQRDLRRYLALAGLYPLPATERRPLVPTSGQATTLSQETKRIVELYHDAAEKLARSN